MSPSAEIFKTKPCKEEDDDEEEEETYSYAMQLSMSVVLPMAMHTAIELGVFEIIAKAGPGVKLSAPEIAAQTPTRNSNAPMMLDRILRLLVSHRVLDCSVFQGERQYGLAPVSKYFVRNQDGISLGSFMALPQDNVFLDSWSQLKNAILEGGIAFNRVHGMHLFDYAATDSRFSEVYNNAMFSHTTIVMNRILESYKGFVDMKKLVDVGGGLGITLATITSKYPHILGVNFDLPHVIQRAPSFPGVEHVGGDMFQSIPKGDAIFMKWILHCWDDDHCLRLLKNCYEAIPDDGKVIVLNAVISELPETSDAARETSLLDVLLLTRDSGGKERTKPEFIALATGAGFKGINFVCYQCNFHIMEFFK
ncbi:hypothetical protein LWI28_008886 [Acer negundo]|uniref:Uncharacterized protein n=1 Tax=Acer negundo TaxID=4023 RepID=A0AAD5IYK7_ACENE|nr:hypothetical protein LWI28_008886 [Acer negundo]